jgi:drug/metabolite transporter (DMT)-like permease
MTVDALRPAPRPGSARLGGNLFAVASTVVWAAGFPAAEGLLDTWHPVPLVPARLGMALAALVVLLLVLEGWPRGLPWGRALWVGGAGLGGAAVLLILAQVATDPVTVAVIACASPLLATLVEWATEGRRLSRGFVLGLVASILGGVVATSAGEAGGGNLALGAALAVGSCLVYSWGTNETVRSLPGQSALARTTATVGGAFLFGLLLALAWAALGGARAAPEGGIAWEDVALLAVYGIGGMALSQMLFVGAVERIGVALASFHLNIAPFYVMLILLALGGDWSWMQALGAGIVVLGVVLAQR